MSYLDLERTERESIVELISDKFIDDEFENANQLIEEYSETDYERGYLSAIVMMRFKTKVGLE